MRARRAAFGARHLGALLGLFLAAATCSLKNVVGPDVTCAALDCGRINACQNGILAACPDGKTLKYHVCADVSCEESWQIPGQYKCDQNGIGCEGCHPESLGCAADAGTEAGP